MAKIFVYNTATGNMETFWRNENESMPYVWNNTMRVREFRGSSNSPTLWTTRQAMESWNAPHQRTRPDSAGWYARDRLPIFF